LKLYRETYRNVVFQTDFYPEQLVAMLDPEQMKRAFVNLIENSIEATEAKGTISIGTTYDKNSRNIKIFFKDDGRGIPPDVKDKLFTPYFSTKREGTGLGLTIVSSIISDHHGFIRVKNNSPKGSIFIIELPAMKSDAIKVTVENGR
jgi:two-component system nitrogen regulation sensor histidine kinase NtrY